MGAAGWEMADEQLAQIIAFCKSEVDVQLKFVILDPGHSPCV